MPDKIILKHSYAGMDVQWGLSCKIKIQNDELCFHVNLKY